MATLSFVSPEEHFALLRRVEQLEQLVALQAEATSEEVDTKTALKLTGIKSEDTLKRERDRPDTLLKYSKHGRSVSYSRASCINYRDARRLNKHHGSPMRIAS